MHAAVRMEDGITGSTPAVAVRHTTIPVSVRLYGFSLLVVTFSTCVRLGMNVIWGARMPFIPFFPAVLVAALYGGIGPGILATLLSALSAAYLVASPDAPRHGPLPENLTGVASFVATSLMMVLVASSQRNARVRAEESAEEALTATQALQAVERRQRVFLREMLFAMTEGRLFLCDTAGDLPAPLAESGGETITLTRPSLRQLRRQVKDASEAAGLPVERLQDLETGAGEAAMNAVVHGGGGTGRTTFDRAAGRVQVRIEDQGRGISEGSLHRATLERGYSSAGTLGHGFWMMLKTCDAVYLLTGSAGTTVVMEQGREAPAPLWARLD